MSKKSFVLYAFLLMLMMAACNDSDSGSAEESPSDSSAAEVPAPVPLDSVAVAPDSLTSPDTGDPTKEKIKPVKIKPEDTARGSRK